MNGSCLRPALLSCALAAALTTLCATPSYAYIDPGSGSYLFQFAIAAIVGGLYALRVFWGRLRPFFASLIFWKRR